MRAAQKVQGLLRADPGLLRPSSGLCLLGWFLYPSTLSSGYSSVVFGSAHSRVGFSCGISPSNGFWMAFLNPWSVDVPWSCLVPSLPRSMFSLWLLSSSPVIGYARLAFAPCVLGHHMVLYLQTSFRVATIIEVLEKVSSNFFF